MNNHDAEPVNPPRRRQCRWWMVLLLLLLLCGYLFVFLYLMLMALIPDQSAIIGETEKTSQPLHPTTNDRVNSGTLPSCAIAFYGLPRNFKRLSLPSIITNVIKANQEDACDYFVHYYYDKTHEILTRGVDRGLEGDIHADEIELLTQAVTQVHTTPPPNPSDTSATDETARTVATDHVPTVQYRRESETSFFRHHQTLLEEIATNKTSFYHPSGIWKLSETSLVNIIKMWHSQQSVFQMLEQWQEDHNHTYQRVAMLRSDVFFLTPIRVNAPPKENTASVINLTVSHTLPTTIANPNPGSNSANDSSSWQLQNTAIIPAFSSYPVNDRMFLGPSEAVRLWATQRFAMLDQHVKRFHRAFHVGIHSENYLYHTLFPLIQKAGFRILTDDSICFFRVRAEGSVRFDDCRSDSGSKTNDIQAVEKLIQHSCILQPKDILHCGHGANRKMGWAFFQKTISAVRSSLSFDSLPF